MLSVDCSSLEPAYVKELGEYMIRQCNLEDLSKVMQINMDTLPEHYSEQFFEELLRENPETFLVAERDKEIVGYIMCRVEFGFLNTRRLGLARKGHIVSVAVFESHRRKGLGRALVESAIDAMKKKGCSEAYLEVRVSNRPAISLYEKLGFSINARLDNYYRDGEAAFSMVVPI